jgi:hypothetical protein
MSRLQGVVLGDHAAHRDTHEVEVAQPQVIDQGLRVGGQ